MDTKILNCILVIACSKDNCPPNKSSVMKEPCRLANRGTLGLFSRLLLQEDARHRL